MNSFDVAGFHFLNQWAGHIPLLDGVMAFVAQYALELYVVLFLAAWFFLPRQEGKQRHALFIMGLSGILALLFNVVIAHFWFRPRPFATLARGTFTKLIPHPADASFPSDHVSGSFGFAVGSFGKTARWIQVSFTLLAVLVGIARVYTGVHWPTDVLGGAVVGALGSFIMWRFSSLLQPISRWVLRLFHFGEYAGVRR
ncbi:undecaprenyl-diphosphatase BcrC [Peptococcaceae bacterium CEB3]|nr:undecaprenyl-diphosphatase BcrC [Peptococcaceae bacterium CEB3]